MNWNKVTLPTIAPHLAPELIEFTLTIILLSSLTLGLLVLLSSGVHGFLRTVVFLFIVVLDVLKELDRQGYLQLL